MSARIVMWPQPKEGADFRGVISDEETQQLAERNTQRLAEAKKRLGSKYLLAHPVTKKAQK